MGDKVGKVRDGTTKRVQEREREWGYGVWGVRAEKGKRATAERKCERDEDEREESRFEYGDGVDCVRVCAFVCRRECDRESEQRGVVACRRRNV